MLRRASLAIVILLSVCAVLPAQQVGRDTFVVSLMGKKWALLVDLPGSTAEKNSMNGEVRRNLIALNQSTGILVSVILEKSVPETNAAACRKIFRETFEKNTGARIQDVREFENGEIALLEYFVSETNGKPAHEKNIVASLVKDSTCATVQIAKRNFQESDRVLFTPVLESLRFLNDAPLTSFEYMRDGLVYYREQNYRKAIGPLSKALELEKESPRLGRILWHVLVDNLGISYGVAGDLSHARETLEYGLSKDPEYPIFYYNLACAAAEEKDMKGAMTYLRQAFERKQNVLPGERMPDPRTDDSFQRFMKDKEFREGVSALAGYLDTLTVNFPGHPWVLRINLPGFKLEQNYIKPDGRAYLYASNINTGILVSVTLERTNKEATTSGCREFLQKRTTDMKSHVFNVRSSERPPFVLLEYDLPLTTTVSLAPSQRNIFACMARQDTYIDVHISKMRAERSDEPRFKAILDSVRIEDGPATK